MEGSGASETHSSLFLTDVAPNQHGQLERDGSPNSSIVRLAGSEDAMKQKWIQLAAWGHLCAFSVGCAHLTQTNSVSSSSGSRSAGSDVVESRVAELVERAIGSQGLEPMRGVQRPLLATQESGQGRARTVSNAQALPSTIRPVEMSDRGETLRVTGPGGEVCAAVAIAPQLAVTALHCVRTLCETPFAKAETSLLGCKIAFELPRATRGHASVVSTSEPDLLALLELEEPLAKSGALLCDNPRASDRVYTVSHPGGQNWTVAYGRLTREPVALEWVHGEATRVLVAEIPTKPGSSGGGLFDNQDRLLGVQIARFSPWTTDFGKAAFIQSSRVFSLAGRYCMTQGSSACVGLRCSSANYDIWEYDHQNGPRPAARAAFARPYGMAVGQ